MAHGLPIKHTSLSRPRMVPVPDNALPAGAEINKRHTPWQGIIKTLVDHTGQWFELTRTYGSVSTAVASARKVLESDYDEATAASLESASMPTSDGQVRVYLRLAEAPADEEVEEDEVVA